MPNSKPIAPSPTLEPTRSRSVSPGEAPLFKGADDFSCDVPHSVRLENARQIHHDVLSVDKAQRMAEFFSLLGDANRLRILSTLAQQELCVCDLAALVSMSESAVSHQLRALRVMRLVGYRKQGRNVFYHLKDEHIYTLYREVAEHLDEPEDS